MFAGRPPAHPFIEELVFRGSVSGTIIPEIWELGCGQAFLGYPRLPNHAFRF